MKPTICLSLCEPDTDSLTRAISEAADSPDLIEIRIDCLDSSRLGEQISKLDRLIQSSPYPAILTLRASGQTSDSTPQGALLAGKFPGAKFIDIESDLLRERPDALPSADWKRVICSFHDFNYAGQKLSEIYDQLASTGAHILKVAVQANDVTDCLPVFELLDRSVSEGRSLIAIAMGPAGVATRILGPSRGAFLTYCSQDEERQTAAGQLTVRELRDVYRIEEINRETAIYGVIGRPVSHSLSPVIHNAAFAAANLNAVYLPFEVTDSTSFLRRMVHPETREIDWPIRGLSVTAPHKSAIVGQLDWIEDTALEVGAVNTIVVTERELRGYNTDASAFLQPVESRLGDVANMRCAILGAGGAASAAALALKQRQAEVTIFARKGEQARSLASRFNLVAANLDGSTFQDFDVVVNTTPLGTRGTHEQETPAAAQQLRGARLAYDLVYNPIETSFLREARAAGCDVLNGLEMFIAQAAAQFHLWTGIDAPIDVMQKAAERKLSVEKRH